ncbi:Lrp/AsnC family transcriptional regulator [Devosia ginsengisoli]|uniref:Lrp/AsnC family transcriptional regulator n=1 Tax=Devosia ginsengisoli TaxID=400770 RepID=UPI0026EBF198|nr:Lrp/AsnC family transcriptional regulator [Devosia ginsengisoli]MCR6672502.1 Lrp/AsnC family transcriptional regulator [Devosia ginsengisoli]
MILDDLDYRLIALLRTNARTPVNKLALDLGVSRATAKARIDRLVQGGAIAGFTVVMASAPGQGIRAITMVEVDGKHEAAVMKRLLGMPEVRQLHNTNGRWDMVAELEAPNVEAFDDLLRQIRQIDGIASTDTSILLKARRSVG